MIKFITISPSSPFNFFLNGKVGGGKFKFERRFKHEFNKLTLVGWNHVNIKLTRFFGKTSFYFKPYRNPSELNKFEFGG